MKIVFCTNDLEYSGPSLYLFDLVAGMKKRNVVQPILYTMRDGPLREKYEALDIPISNYLDWKFDRLYLNGVFNYHLIERAKVKGVPSFWAIHESQPNLHYPEQKQLIHLLKCLQMPRAVIFQSHCTANVYGKFAPGHNFEIAPGAVQIATGPNRSVARKTIKVADELVVLTVGTVAKHKGQDDIPACLHHLFRPIRWFVIGKQSHTISADPRIVMIAQASPEELTTYYKAADLYVCTSRVESYPRTILEALGHGLPIVTTPVYGIKEQVKGNFYTPGDAADLAAKIEDYQRPVEKMQHWSFEEMLDRYYSIISG